MDRIIAFFGPVKKIIGLILSKRRYRYTLALLMLGVWYLLSVPKPLFDSSYSFVVTDKDNKLLSARIAADEQWRFPIPDSLPEKYVQCVKQFEDRHFDSHIGVYLPSLGKAMLENIKARSVVRGGSTITMQLVRLSRGNPPRTIPQKVAEIFVATRIELSFSKDEIMAMYAAHAPFGGNVVGLNAAAWRFYGKDPFKLSWAEAATLAVLPNSPGLIYPGKNSTQLRDKRNRLLRSLKEEGIIDGETCELAMNEPLPGTPHKLPDAVPHLLSSLPSKKIDRIVTTTIDAGLQETVTDIVDRYHKEFKGTKINNLAVVVLDTRTGAVRAYVGNAPNAGKESLGDVDVARSVRSTGSIMKPFLYGMMLDEGTILPEMLVRDVPVQIGTFRPMNYHRNFNGAIPARKALSRSLNVPAVNMLQDFGVGRFCDRMEEMGMSTLIYPPSHYGLSVILGGGEAKLIELCGIYASMGRTLMHYTENDARYSQNDFHPPVFLRENALEEVDFTVDQAPVLSASSIYLTFEAMKEVSRPSNETNWKYFDSKATIAWKTGTSFGNRDAWAIGVSPNYVVGVWVGNANGEGRPSLTGVGAAAPVMFDVINRLNTGGWFEIPYDDMTSLVICKYSGYPASEICEETDTVLVPDNNLKLGLCPYHQIIHLDPQGNFRVNSECEAAVNMIHKSWFVLPPVIEYYFKPGNPFYKTLPPLRDDCEPLDQNRAVMDVIYPRELSHIYVPIELSGDTGKVIFEVAHRDENAKIYWYLDDEFIGVTTNFHKRGLRPSAGWHTLSLNDEQGNRISRRFHVLERED